MSRNWIEVTMEDNSKLYIETAGPTLAEDEDPLMTPAASGDGVVRRTEDLLKKSFTQIKNFSDSIAASIRSSAVCPEEFELEFGVKFAADAGIVISSLSSEANVTIRMKWAKNEECQR